jgi:hypothetical protein
MSGVRVEATVVVPGVLGSESFEEALLLTAPTILSRAPMPETPPDDSMHERGVGVTAPVSSTQPAEWCPALCTWIHGEQQVRVRAIGVGDALSPSRSVQVPVMQYYLTRLICIAEYDSLTSLLSPSCSALSTCAHGIRSSESLYLQTVYYCLVMCRFIEHQAALLARCYIWHPMRPGVPNLRLGVFETSERHEDQVQAATIIPALATSRSSREGLAR